MSSEPPFPTAPPTPTAPPSGEQRRAADRPVPARDPSKAPAAVPVVGALAVLVAMLTLCAGGLRLVRPEGALGVDALGPVFEVALARRAILFSLVLWVALSVLLAVAGSGLLLARSWGRTLGLVWAWSSVGLMCLMIAVNAVFVAPSLDDSDLSGIDLVRTLLAGPAVGCCPIAFALAMLAVLHHDAVSAWATRRP